MNLLLKLASLCLLTISAADGNLWCYCDNDLCTTNFNGNVTEVCPDLITESTKKILLTAFFKDNRHGRTMQTLLEILLEKGFDQKKIAEFSRGIRQDDAERLLQALGVTAEKARMFFATMEKEAVESVMKEVTELVREITKSKRDKKMTDEHFALIKATVVRSLYNSDLPKEVLAEVVKLLTKLNVREFFKDETRNSLKKRMRKMENLMRVDAGEYMRYLAETSRGEEMTDEEFAEAKKVLATSLLNEGLSEVIVNEVLASSRNDTLGVILPRRSAMDDLIDFIEAHPNNSNAINIKNFTAMVSLASRERFQGEKVKLLTDDEFENMKENVALMLTRRDLPKADKDNVLLGMDKYNIEEFITMHDNLINFMAAKLGGLNEKDFVKKFVDKLPQTDKTAETDIMDIKNSFVESVLQHTKGPGSNMTMPKVKAANRVEGEVQQFCLKAILHGRQSIRFCGHFATQLTGFEFREGCHYEEILGLADAQFCRCSTYLCNSSSRLLYMDYLLYVSQTLLLLKHFL